MNRMDDTDEIAACYLLDHDPRNLLPFERELEPHDPNVERLPNAYVGTDQQVYGGNYV